MKTVNKYRGLTYLGSSFLWRGVFGKMWRKYFCSRNMHLFDEVWSTDRHYLSCDACDLEVGIAYIDDEWVGKDVSDVL